MRKFLGLNYEDATIRAREFASPIITGPGRDGPPAEESISESKQTIAWLDFDGKLGVFDFAGDQYFSWVRTNRLLVRGERGEIHDAEVRYLRDHRTPIEMTFRRVNAGENGNLEGLYMKGVMLGDEWIYRNPCAPASLTDDEIAVATCLTKMAEYAGGGPDFYSVSEASQDHYLGMMIAEAARTGETIRTTHQPWA